MQFQTGYLEFSENVGMNFQLNRFYSMGVMEKAELMKQILYRKQFKF